MRANARLLRAAAGFAGVLAVSGLLAGCAPARKHSIKDEAAPRFASHSKSSRYKARPARLRHVSNQPVRITPSVQRSTCGTDAVCLARLKALVEDKNRKWVGQPQPQSDHLSGTRQFAYLALRSKLSCAELAAAINEITAIPQNISAPGVPADHVARVQKLDGQVVTELRAERSARCPNS